MAAKRKLVHRAHILFLFNRFLHKAQIQKSERKSVRRCVVVLCETGTQAPQSWDFSLLFYGFPSIKCLRTRLPHHTVKYCLP
jgi:hypothetical protein